MSAGAINIPWGTVGEVAKDATSVGVRANPIGVFLSLLFPTSLNEGEDAQIAEMNRRWEEEQAKKKAEEKTRDIATSRTCNPSQDKSCKDKDEHRGVIQAQEGSGMLVPGRNWGPQPKPPSFTQCKGLLDKVYDDLKEVKGGGNEFQKGAKVAYDNLTDWMRKTTPSGWSAGKEPCSYFNGDMSPSGWVRRHTGKNSRRIDFSVKKGRALTSF